MESGLQCEICSLAFNLEERLPKIMPCCGTSFCLDCVVNVLPTANEAELRQEADQNTLCKKCAQCN